MHMPGPPPCLALASLTFAPPCRPFSCPGIPDWHKFPDKSLTPNLLEDPVLKSIAQKHNKTPAQVSIKWQWQLGIPVNPRCDMPNNCDGC